MKYSNVYPADSILKILYTEGAINIKKEYLSLNFITLQSISPFELDRAVISIYDLLITNNVKIFNLN